MALNGIDIASYQAKLNTAKIMGDFVIVKATQGTGYINPTWRNQISAAKAAGKLVGLYHYANGSGVQGEVNFFLQTIREYIGKAILCLDWEHIPNGGPNRQFWNPDYAKQFMDEVKKRTNVTMFLYCSKDACCNAMDWSAAAKIYPLWGAQYANNNQVIGYQVNPWQSSRPWGAWGKTAKIHQYTSNLRLPGWAAGLDGNIAYMTKEEWQQFAGAKERPTIVQPPAADQALDKANLLELVAKTRHGDFGNGEGRMAKLGSRYKEVQGMIDYIDKASVNTLAAEAISGKYGDGELRRDVLGNRYKQVQAAVDRKLKKMKSVTKIAQYVIRGKYGDGEERVKKLRAEGYDSAAVQKELDRLYAA